MGANSEGIRVELLGSLRAWHDGVEVPLGPPKQRAVLGLLASRVGDVVALDQIIDAVWGEDAPKSCSNGVHTYVAGLRRALEPARSRKDAGSVLVSTARGYSLELDPERVDVHVLARRHGTARRLRAAGDLAGAVAALDPALHLWRGDAYAGVPGPFALVERARLRDVRLTAVEEWAADMLGLDRRAEVVEVLTGAIAEEPLRERLPALLMLGLYRCGRQAHALEVYRRTRVLLADELGIEPGEQLTRLHERILAGDPELRAPEPRTAAPRTAELRTTGAETGEPREPQSSGGEVAAPVAEGTASAAVAAREGAGRLGLPGPAQLPPTARGFVGRQAEADALADLLTREERRGAPRVAVVHGVAGVGKSAFALAAAHRLADRFPDGQLYVDLCGSSSRRAPVAPPEALGLLLVGLGVAEDRLPADVTSRAALYRSLLHGRRVLVVLDDAVDAEQVRPLIPPGPSGLIVTSRRRQVELAVHEGAHRVRLGRLAEDECLDLLGCLAGAERVAAQPDAAARLARLCGRLPLALRVAAEALSANPRLTPAELADRYAKRRHRADELPPVARLRSAGTGPSGTAAPVAERSRADHPGRTRAHRPAPVRITGPFHAVAAREPARPAPGLPDGVLPFPASARLHATYEPKAGSPAGDGRGTGAGTPPVVVVALADDRLADGGADLSSRLRVAVRALTGDRPDATVVVLAVDGRAGEETSALLSAVRAADVAVVHLDADRDGAPPARRSAGVAGSPVG
ncbi:BTAD domain-containing putative transcriptional regulator [Actinosynnema sp. NPDC050436]|uniref:AfsR/SARP family transcriptional regulator n=1 Tax=Actinosynnema sp. NPDC050436 TaxID=3155659 RepID=UPI0033EB1D97